MNDLSEFPAGLRLRTLHVDLGRSWRGGQHQAYLLACGLRDRGHEAEVFTAGDSPLACRVRDAGIPIRATAAGASRLRAAWDLRRLLRRCWYDVIHCHDAHGLAAAWLARAHRRASVVAARRVAYPLSRGVAGLSRYHSARCIVAVSKFVRESVLACGIAPGKVAVVFDGVEAPPPVSTRDRLEARRELGLVAGTPLVGCVGYLLPEKGQDRLIRALPLIIRRHPGCRLLLAGDGPCRRSLGRLADALGVQDSVLFLGHVEDVSRVYRALDVFLFPSLAEPLGSSLLAAMAHGLAAVAISKGAVPEIIADQSNGLLADEPEPAQIAAAALRLLDDHALAARLGAAARVTVEQRFTASGMVDATLALYRKIKS
ncbi:MAG TPA: glycosyltransferase family 4 protein [Bryobacteraceae bacterium]|nr:glycosyltransferase family 4 protein [Bryobacteraceae bacterium]